MSMGRTLRHCELTQRQLDVKAYWEQQGVPVSFVEVPTLYEAMAADAARMERETADYVRECRKKIAAHVRAKNLRIVAAATLVRMQPGFATSGDEQTPLRASPGASRPNPAMAGVQTAPPRFVPASLSDRVHEAGHVVVAVSLGAKVHRVHASAAAAFVTVTPTRRAEIDAAVCVAGLEAERILCGTRHSSAVLTQCDDVREMRRICPDACDSMRAAATADRIIRDRRASVSAVAAALETRPDLNEAEILRLCQ